MPDLTAAERAGMDAWMIGSADSTQCLIAIRAALRVARAEVAEEIARELETSGFESQMDADFAARIARQHATT
jgi:hypothetical protein